MSQYPAQPNYQTPPPAKGSAALAVTSLVLGIVSIFPGCCLTQYAVLAVGVVALGIVAVVLGVMARGQVARGEASGGGMALAGIITGALGAIFGLVLLILVLAAPHIAERLTNWGKQMQQRQQQQSQPATPAPPQTQP